MRIGKVALLALLAVSASALKVESSAQSEPAQMLAQKTTTSSSTKKDDDPYGFGEFMTGCVLIPFALVFLWKNEKKLVTYAKCMDAAQEDCITVDNSSVDEKNNFRLVHTTGKTQNDTELVDNEFAVTAENSYRLTRTVEMFQWQEHHHAKTDSHPEHWTYSKGWFTHHIDSSGFRESGHENPGNEWPFKSNTIAGQNVTLGQYRLSASQISRLGHSNRKDVAPEDKMVEATADAMSNCGFSAFEARGKYLVASTDDNSLVGDHIGQYRVSFTYDKCDTTTIIAQQMQDDDEVFTFRKWNPEKIHVPYGNSTDAEGDETCGNPLCCYICMCVNCCFSVMFEEVVDRATDGKETKESYFESQQELVKQLNSVFRPLGIVATIMGFYMLFAPVIKLLAYIPLVGWLLSSLTAVAAFVFALVVGGTMSCLVIAIAWVFFRPLIGIPLLLVVCASIYMIYFYDWEKGAVTDGSSSSDVTPSSDT